MSLTNPTDVVTEERLKLFYDTILPYLGGAASAGFTPIGTVIAVMGNAAPANYLACNGQVVNIADYPELANYFEQQFGSKNYFGGDGTTTFAICDLRGEFLRGTGTNSHTLNGNGAAVGTHQDSTSLPVQVCENNTYYFQVPDVYGGNSNNAWIKNVDKSITPSMVSGNIVNTFTANGTYSQRGQSNLDSSLSLRPTNTSVLYCIATKNIYMGGGGSSMNYSTDEQVVGTWINGKTLYQKTIKLTLPTWTGSSQVEYATPIGASVDRIVDIRVLNKNTENGEYYSTDQYQFAGSISTTTTMPVNTFRIVTCDNSHSSTPNTIIYRSNNATYCSSNWEVYATIRYIKTTD